MENQTVTILEIETSTNVCSIALSEENSCLFSKVSKEGLNHAVLLSKYIQEALQVLKTRNKKLNAVAVSSGPGSYTGLRIGVATAKGLCYGLNIPLISINTLEILTIPVLRIIKEENALFCPMIDARRMEVYTAFYNAHLEIIRPISSDIINNDSYKKILEKNPVYFFGNGMNKCKEYLQHSNAHFIENILPLATSMIPLSLKAYQEKQFENTAYFEPFYLKEFQITHSKKKL
ncbi:MAG TPA: tRNA (adenosine(37)-N6)-threonylcarbamoyltransferase complex dimerization subunit type 1 TsaB [Paludibacteraceae bacterium]|jgi:tRNA threonylcarbamoyladenosine biosynthesis protein TsaB|nr:tRNA (adenosine(37)-N6)-threonylcarbamoyltransferase complex dimerization subunit type 1 TsaB [Paludibacteraceae bacterium]HOV84552.1 tRNA (adenosine(37)-N6)-threonylcarbamoyltransferase complex dimerization subunit type 1 TsaB [Paludibacteraceae bacterium]